MSKIQDCGSVYYYNGILNERINLPQLWKSQTERIRKTFDCHRQRNKTMIIDYYIKSRRPVMTHKNLLSSNKSCTKIR